MACDTIKIETLDADEVVSIVTAGPQGPSGSEAATLTTTGDLLYRAALANDRLPIGSEGQVLKVSSGLPAWGNESGAVTSVNGETGVVVLDAADVGAVPEIDVRSEITLTENIVLLSGRNVTQSLRSFAAATIDVKLPETNIQTGDVFKITAKAFSSGAIRIVQNYSSGVAILATITSGSNSYTFRAQSSSDDSWEIVLVDTHTHAASAITSGTLDIARIPTGTGSTQVALGDHTHTQLHDRSHAITSTSDHTAGNHKVFYSDGSGQIQELALGNSGEVLTSNGATSAPSFAAASGGGVTAVNSTLADILSVSGSDLVADDLGSDKLYGWDDSESKAIGFTIGSGLSVSGDTISATATGTIGGSTGSTDNSLLRSDGTGGSTVQDSALVVDDAVVAFTGITGDAGTDIITATGSGFSNGQRVRFTALTGGSGLNTTTNYFVINASGDTFQVSTTEGGSFVNFTTNITNGKLLNAHNTQVNVAISQNTTETNSAICIAPKGDAAFIVGPQPDGTSTGGNARGQHAICMVRNRSNAAQVASSFGSVAIGYRVTSSGSGSLAMGGETSATAQSSTALGTQTTASGIASFVVGGNVLASNQYAQAFGFWSLADRYAIRATASGRFAASGVNTGDAQHIRAVLRNKTTTNSAVELFLDGSSQRLTIASGKVMAMLINVTGVKSDGSAVAHYVRQYCIKNVGGTTSEVYAPVTIGTDNAAGTSITVEANDTNDALRINVTGIASETWRWVASVDAVEVAYGS